MKLQNLLFILSFCFALTVSAQDLDFSNEATEQLPCTYEDDPLTIGFNAKFLIEMLNVLESDEIKIELSTPTRAGILLPTEASEDEEILIKEVQFLGTGLGFGIPYMMVMILLFFDNRDFIFDYTFIFSLYWFFALSLSIAALIVMFKKKKIILEKYKHLLN